MFLLEEIPSVLVCLETPEPHIRVLWSIQYVTPSLARLTQKDGRVLAFA